jgi:pyruvate/2-oxoglutarate dehydrogenase complex dihydrolipoamide dehydrogenase (E3) component
MKFDVVVIGGGSAGYAAARTAADLGAKVGIVDRGPLGGLCILRGCMPSKTLLRSSDIMSLMHRAREFGLSVSDVKADMAAINDRKRALIKEFADYRVQQLKSPRFTLIRGRARFVSPTEIRVGSRAIQARSFVVATGSTLQKIPIPGLEDVGYITSDEVLDQRKLPASAIVLGGGAIATELGQFLCRMGTRTTLIQRSGHILSNTDEDLARPIEARFREEGMKLFTGTRLTRFTQSKGRATPGKELVTRDKKLVTAHFEQAGKLRRASAETVLQALGRVPDLDGLNLNRAGVQVERGRIVVDDRMRTTAPNVFAAGDCTGLFEVVHIAIQQGEAAGHNAIAGTRKQSVDYRLGAFVVFTEPQLGSVGLTEKACRESRIEYRVATYPFDDHGKSMTMGETHGFVKLLCDPESGEILGGHVVGPEASELMHELVAVMYYRGTVHDLARIPHYHPTLSEILTYPAEELADQIPETPKRRRR